MTNFSVGSSFQSGWWPNCIAVHKCNHQPLCALWQLCLDHKTEHYYRSFWLLNSFHVCLTSPEFSFRLNSHLCDLSCNFWTSKLHEKPFPNDNHLYMCNLKLQQLQISPCTTLVWFLCDLRALDFKVNPQLHEFRTLMLNIYKCEMETWTILTTYNKFITLRWTGFFFLALLWTWSLPRLLALLFLVRCGHDQRVKLQKVFMDVVCV